MKRLFFIMVVFLIFFSIFIFSIVAYSNYPRKISSWKNLLNNGYVGENGIYCFSMKTQGEKNICIISNPVIDYFPYYNKYDKILFIYKPYSYFYFEVKPNKTITIPPENALLYITIEKIRNGYRLNYTLFVKTGLYFPSTVKRTIILFFDKTLNEAFVNNTRAGSAFIFKESGNEIKAFRFYWINLTKNKRDIVNTTVISIKKSGECYLNLVSGRILCIKGNRALKTIFPRISKVFWKISRITGTKTIILSRYQGKYIFTSVTYEDTTGIPLYFTLIGPVYGYNAYMIGVLSEFKDSEYIPYDIIAYSLGIRDLVFFEIWDIKIDC